MKNTSTTHSYKILSMVLAIAMIFSMLPVMAFAEAEPDDSSYATSGVTVSGREDDSAPPDDNTYATSGVTVPGTEEDEQPEPPAAHSIVAFAALADSVAMQTVTVDATRADLTLPESLAQPFWTAKLKAQKASAALLGLPSRSLKP